MNPNRQTCNICKRAVKKALKLTSDDKTDVDVISVQKRVCAMTFKREAEFKQCDFMMKLQGMSQLLVQQSSPNYICRTINACR